MKKKKKIISNILYVLLIYILFFLSRLIYYAMNWSIDEYGEIPFSQIVFHLKVPLTGTSDDIINEFIEGFVKDSLAVLIIVFVILIILIIINIRNKKEYIFKINKRNSDKTNVIKIKLFTLLKLLTAFLVIANLAYDLNFVYVKLGIGEYLEELNKSTTLYEDYYVDASKTEITFPEEKKNLIYIFVESLETTYASKAYNGAMTENHIPMLTELAVNNENFSAGEYLNGARQMVNTTWTVAGMVSETSGVPLSLPIDGNSYGDYETFLPGITTLGDILEENGYNQMLMLGSDASFGGRRNYFLQHGNYFIYDLYTARENGKISDDYFVWWGYEDEKLFEYAKEEITKMAASDEPFNFTMLTADTHFPNGYSCELCGSTFHTQIENVIACSDKQIGEFVEWIQEQDFYDDTVIIIAGDHNNMSSSIETLYGNQSYVRTTYFTVINSDTERMLADTDRIYTRMDIFPTTLASLGCTIEGNRLGLGTNLYSDQKTISEIIGTDAYNVELSRTSKFYNNKLLQLE